MIYLGGVGLAFFLTLLLLSKKQKTSADTILAGWLFVMTAHLLFFAFHKMTLYPELLGVALPMPLLHGPFLYLYTRSLTNHSLSWKVSIIHFIPFMAAVIYLIPFFTLPVEQKIVVYENNGKGYETFSQINFLAICASGILYVLLSVLTLRKHRISIANQFSYVDKINLQWMQYLIYWMGVIWLLVIFTNDDWIFIATVLFVLFIGFFGIRQAGIFHTPPTISTEGKNPKQADEIPEEIAEDIQPDSKEKRKYQKSGLSADSSEALHQQLIKIMSTDRLYCQSELSLADLAERLSTQPNYLSQVINEREGKNFYDYINTLRIEEFKRIASSQESRKYTLMALAQQCGFTSKSSFNRYFKKVTTQSPSEFMQAFADSQK